MLRELNRAIQELHCTWCGEANKYKGPHGLGQCVPIETKEVKR